MGSSGILSFHEGKPGGVTFLLGAFPWAPPVSPVSSPLPPALRQAHQRVSTQALSLISVLAELGLLRGAQASPVERGR